MIDLTNVLQQQSYRLRRARVRSRPQQVGPAPQQAEQVKSDAARPINLQTSANVPCPVSRTQPSNTMMETTEKNQKRVRFSEQVHLRSNPTILTDKEMQAGWLQPEEKEEIMRDNREAIFFLSPSNEEESDPNALLYDDGSERYCSRGLEPWIDPATHFYTKRKIISFVLAEQARQKTDNADGTVDDTVLSQMYMGCSRFHVQRAHCHGLRDQDQELRLHNFQRSSPGTTVQLSSPHMAVEQQERKLTSLLESCRDLLCQGRGGAFLNSINR